MFQALADSERLRLLLRLAEGEACVSELAEYEGEKITTVSARLKTLFTVRLVKRRREAKHIFYALADEHVLPLVRNVRLAVNPTVSTDTVIRPRPAVPCRLPVMFRLASLQLPDTRSPWLVTSLLRLNL